MQHRHHDASDIVGRHEALDDRDFAVVASIDVETRETRHTTALQHMGDDDWLLEHLAARNAQTDDRGERLVEIFEQVERVIADIEFVGGEHRIGTSNGG